MWLVFHEYETFQHTTPLHAWSYINSTKTKEEAAKMALELNYETYCKSLFNRFPPNHPRKNPYSQSDKHKIVSYILKNIQDKSNSENCYYGIGFFIIEEKQFNIKRGELKTSPHITDIKQHLIKQRQRSESPTKKSDSETQGYDYDSEYDTEEEECYDSLSDSETEAETHLESDEHASDTSVRSKTSNISNKSRTSRSSQEGDISIYSD